MILRVSPSGTNAIMGQLSPELTNHCFPNHVTQVPLFTGQAMPLFPDPVLAPYAVCKHAAEATNYREPR